MYLFIWHEDLNVSLCLLTSSWSKPTSSSTTPAFTVTSAVSSVSPVWFSPAIPPCVSVTWFTLWSCGASPVSTPSSLQVTAANLYYILKHLFSKSGSVTVWIVNVLIKKRKLKMTELCWTLLFDTNRARLLLHRRPGSISAPGYEVCLLPHWHTAQLPPGVKAS